MSILVIAEHDNEEIKASTNNVVTAATNLEGDIHVTCCRIKLFWSKGSSCKNIRSSKGISSRFSRIRTLSRREYCRLNCCNFC